MNYQYIDFTVSDQVAWIAFNRPDQLNAMNLVLMRELCEALDQANCEPNIRSIVLSGKGDKAFMAGADIKEYAQYSASEFEYFQKKGREVYNSLEGNAKPTIAMVDGYAFGGGFEIVLACDIVYATPESQFALPEILLNLIPGGGGTQRIVKKIGLNRANEMLMTGKTVSAETLERYGVVNQVINKNDLKSEVKALCQSLIKRPPEALRSLKQLTQIAQIPINSAAQALENEILSRLYFTPKAQEKIQNFANKKS